MEIDVNYEEVNGKYSELNRNDSEAVHVVNYIVK